MNFVGVHDTQTLVSYLVARPRRLTLTSSSTFASRAFLSHWRMRNKAQMLPAGFGYDRSDGMEKMAP